VRFAGFAGSLLNGGHVLVVLGAVHFLGRRLELGGFRDLLHLAPSPGVFAVV
jgi:hypothetical protein